MKDIEIELNAEELAAIHNLANELECSPNQALVQMVEHYLGANKQPNNLSAMYSQISVLFSELAEQVA